MNRIIIAFMLCALAFVLPLTALAKPKTSVPVVEADGTFKTVSCQPASKKTKSGHRWKKRNKRRKGGRNKTRASGVTANQACKSLLPSKLVGGIGQLPGLSRMVNSEIKLGGRNTTQAVTGTPPTLSSIPNQIVKELFWREGVVDRIAAGSPTPEDCNEFFSGNEDGQSAGLAGCFLAGQTGRALQEAVESGTSLCIMRNIPDQADSVAITILSGEENLPDSDFSKVFDTPNSGPRLVEIRTVGDRGEPQALNEEGEEGEQEEGEEEEEGNASERIFVRINDKAANKSSKSQYSFDIFFCAESENTLTEYESTTIGKEGKITISKASQKNDDTNNISVTGYLTDRSASGDKSVTFNPLILRTLDVNVEDGGGLEKSRLELTSENTILAKVYNLAEGRRAYSVLNYTGTSTKDARLLEGAYKDEKDGNPDDGFRALVEYREKYVSAPQSSFGAFLDSVDLKSDSFYTAPQVTFNSTLFDCSTAADVVVQMDLSHPDLASILTACGDETLTDMDFCEMTEEIRDAEQNYDQACSGGEEEEENN